MSGKLIKGENGPVALDSHTGWILPGKLPLQGFNTFTDMFIHTYVLYFNSDDLSLNFRIWGNWIYWTSVKVTLQKITLKTKCKKLAR